MSAFAAILHRDDGPTVHPPIAAVLSDVAGRPASALTLGRCTLITAPLHPDDVGSPLVTPAGAWVGVASEDGASAAWDAAEQTLTCRRDGLGLRLLYVAESPSAIVVSNVLAAALRHPRICTALDDTALLAFLAHGGAADEVRTCYRDIKVLPPGHTLTIDGRSFTARLARHWHFPQGDGVRRSGSQILEEYRALLADAVRERLGPGGTSIFLSGGIDSTTMAAAAVQVAAPGTLQAITTRYPRYVDDLELPFARAAAARLGLPLTIIDADRHVPWQVEDDDPPVAFPLDEPMLADWRDALARAARHGTVALYGEDGDALLRPPAWKALRHTASIGAIGFAAANYMIRQRRLPYIGLRWRERLGLTPRRTHAVPAWLSAAAVAALTREEPATVLGGHPESLPPHPARPEAQAILTSTTISRHFAAIIAPETTRRRIELRFPILDTRLMRFVMSIPAIPWCQEKALPRRAYRGRLPRAILDRPKTPLIGFNEGMVEAWRRATGGRAVPPGEIIGRWIDVGHWTRTLEQGSAEAVMAAWRVIALESWLVASGAGAVCTR